MKVLSHLYLLIAGFLIIYSSYQAVISSPSEGDSLAYHLPIAQNILQGKWHNFETEEDTVRSLLQYYPASSHVILAGFMAAGIPQFFNVVGLIILGVLSYFTARQINLPHFTATIVAVTASSLPSLSRLTLSQTIDVWLALWFMASLLILLRYKATLKYAALAGILLGMLIGSKYTGPFFAVLLVSVFRKKLLTKANLRYLPTSAALLTLSGLVWYIRNWLNRGDIFYPSSHPLFHLDEQYNWQTLFLEPGRFLFFLQSLFSEYGIWAAGLLLTPYVLYKRFADPLSRTIALVTLGSFAIHLLLPASPANMLSDLRYAAPTFLVVILLSYRYASSIGISYPLALVGTLQLFMIFSLRVAHQPKVFVGYMIGVLALIANKHHFAAACRYLDRRLQSLMSDVRISTQTFSKHKRN